MNYLSDQIQTALEQVSAPPILTWKSKKIGGALITKIGQQRYLGLRRKDSKGQEYWKYHLLTKVSEPVASPSPVPKSEGGKIEESKNSDIFPSKGESEQVKQFREKYGTANEPKRSIQ